MPKQTPNKPKSEPFYLASRHSQNRSSSSSRTLESTLAEEIRADLSTSQTSSSSRTLEATMHDLLYEDISLSEKEADDESELEKLVSALSFPSGDSELARLLRSGLPRASPSAVTGGGQGSSFSRPSKGMQSM
ncbi:hypothetical protein DXG03_004657 [Asterophora parasitica]|uniref:Uncharacterized protein n=1 Tax=Asterophora parasitica TaxID=117018 RepID=A0A9P7G6B9_9AGAR|nr:hypothetical protein DXG03_004657 [Asterophora parasitica]